MQKHPAKFTPAILAVLENLTISGRILDPFAGTGRIHQLADSLFVSRTTVGVEIEPEWANLHPRTIVGNALHLPFEDESFDGVVTSCTYGNRLADHHNAGANTGFRHSYTHTLGRRLHEDNSGQLQWGDKYREFHQAAWQEVWRVLRPGGQFILNIKDHIRQKQAQPVCEWHKHTILDLGFREVVTKTMSVPSLRYGRNRERLGYELVMVFEKPE